MEMDNHEQKEIQLRGLCALCVDEMGGGGAQKRNNKRNNTAIVASLPLPPSLVGSKSVRMRAVASHSSQTNLRGAGNDIEDDGRDAEERRDEFANHFRWERAGKKIMCLGAGHPDRTTATCKADKMAEIGLGSQILCLDHCSSMITRTPVAVVCHRRRSTGRAASKQLSCQAATTGI
jgi:hypothetical protein